MAKIKIVSTLNNTDYKRGVKEMQKSNKRFGDQLGGMKAKLAGAFAIAGIAKLARQASQLGSELSDLATQSGLTTDEIQGVEFASIKAGVGTEKIRTAMGKINVVLGQAKSGMKTYVDLFNKIGVSQKKLQTLGTREALEAVAKTMSEAQRGSVEFGAALEIIGTRSGLQMVEVLGRINEVGLSGLIKDAKEANFLLSEEMIQNLDAIEDRLQIVQRQIKIGFAVGADWLVSRVREAAGFWATILNGGGLDEARSIRQKEADAALERKFQKEKAFIDEKAAKDEASDKAAQARLEERNKLLKEQIKKTAESVKLTIDTDRFRKIGGMAGSTTSASFNNAQRALEIQKKQEALLKTIADNTEEQTGGLL